MGNLSDGFAEQLIRSGMPLKEAREVIIDTMAEEQRRTQPATRKHDLDCFDNGYDNPQFLQRAIGEAIHARVNPQHKPSEAAHPFIGRSLVEIARECLHHRNVSTRMMGGSQIMERALGGLHGTSDFALALGDAVGRELARAYEAAGPGVLLAGRQVTATDFRSHFPVRIGDAPVLEEVGEHGEFKSGTIIESSQPAWRIKPYGKIFGMTRQAIINDDLNAFTDIPRKFGIMARELENKIVVDALVSNSGAGPTLGDSVALFHANHGNLASPGTALSVTSLGAARAAMRLQKSTSGNPINVVPTFLLVPAALETLAEQLLTAIAATKAADVNPFGAKKDGKLELIVDPRLDAVSATRWYVVADPGRVDGLQYAYLEGQGGPTLETEYGFRTDGVEWKVRHDFGAGFIEHRSWYANPGA